MLDALDFACIQTPEELDDLLIGLGVERGDLDADGTVDFDDLVVLGSNFPSSTGSYAIGDLDLNGLVNFADYLQVSNTYTPGTMSATVDTRISVSIQLDGSLALRNSTQSPINVSGFEIESSGGLLDVSSLSFPSLPPLNALSNHRSSSLIFTRIGLGSQAAIPPGETPLDGLVYSGAQGNAESDLSFIWATGDAVAKSSVSAVPERSQGLMLGLLGVAIYGMRLWRQSVQ